MSPLWRALDSSPFWSLVLFPSHSRGLLSDCFWVYLRAPGCPLLRSLVAPDLASLSCFYFMSMKVVLVCHRIYLMYEKA